jgi:hypothetical protein
MKPVIVLVALGLASLRVVLGAESNGAAAGDPVVELPKFVVTDSRELPPPESWRHAAIPGFEILTNASDKATQRLIKEFEMFRQALGYVWPIPNRVAHSTSLILCGKGAKFDAFVPAGKSGVDTATVSLFLKRGNQAAIVIDMQATTLNVLNVDDSNDAATGTDSGLISVEHDKQLYREYVRYLLSQNEPRAPAWFEEGLSQIIMKMTFDKRSIEFAKLEDPNTVSVQAAMNMELNAAAAAFDADTPALPGAPAEDRDFAAALRRKALVPMDKFFAVTHDSEEATNPLGNNRWAKQAYAFVHMCLYGNRGKYQKMFVTFLQRSAREPVTEAMFKECFRIPKSDGKFKEISYKDMLMEIRGYCDFTVYEAKLFTAKKGGPDLIDVPKPLALREATQSEVGRIKGEALVLAGHEKQARAELIAPYQRGERDPDLLAALGVYEKNAGENERARKFLEAAFAGKSKRPDANLELARYRYADALAKPAEAGGLFSSAQVSAVIEPLKLGRGQPPHLYPLYELAAETWVRSGMKPKRDDVMIVIEGAQLFPTRLKLVFQAAALAGEAGEYQAAHALADHGIKYSPEAAGKKRFEDLKKTFPPAPPAAPEPETKANPPAKKSPAASPVHARQPSLSVEVDRAPCEHVAAGPGPAGTRRCGRVGRRVDGSLGPGRRTAEIRGDRLTPAAAARELALRGDSGLRDSVAHFRAGNQALRARFPAAAGGGAGDHAGVAARPDAGADSADSLREPRQRLRRVSARGQLDRALRDQQPVLQELGARGDRDRFCPR